MPAQMNRRDMLKLFTAGIVSTLVLDPEKLLWVPGEKTIFLPPLPSEPIVPPQAFLWQLTVKIDPEKPAPQLPKELASWEWIEIERIGNITRYGSNNP